MNGSKQKRGKNSYLLEVYRGKTLDGERDRVTKTVKVEGKTEKEKEKNAEIELALFIKEVESGWIDSENLSFEGFTKYWLENYAETELEEKTKHEYKGLLNLRINPAIGHIRLSKLKPTYFIELYKNLSEEGIRLDTKYKPTETLKEKIKEYKAAELSREIKISTRTITQLRNLRNVNKDIAEKVAAFFNLKILDLFEEKSKSILTRSSVEHYRRLINSVLNTAVTWGKLPSNPAKGIKISKKRKKNEDSPNIEVIEQENEEIKVKYYDLKQTQTMIDFLDDAPIKYKAIILLTLYTATREGELMGLDLPDLSIENSVVKVNVTSQYIPGKGTFEKDKPKNSTSKREIAYDDEINPILEEYLEWREQQKKACGDKWSESGKLFVRENGKPMYTYTPYKWFKSFLEKKGLPNLTFHGLRHTHPTLLLEMGFEDLNEIQKRMGHADIRTTINYYAHKTESVDRKAAKLFGSSLKKEKAELKVV